MTGFIGAPDEGAFEVRGFPPIEQRTLDGWGTQRLWDFGRIHG
jgi:hypothetical protein